MCNLRGIFQLICIVFFLSFSQQNFYETGLELVKKGDIDQALIVWEQGRKNLGKDNLSDPRIGIAYIETVIANVLTDRYEKAIEIYFWGLSGKNIDNHIDDIVAEAKRIVPLLDSNKAKIWNGLIRKKSTELSSKIKGYWLKNDPTPATIINERMIEHWGRINYSRKHYGQVKASPYGTDDRGTIFVKYGEPFSKRNGVLGKDVVEINRWYRQIAEYHWDRENHAKPLNNLSESNIRQKLVGRITGEQFHPEYEIWKYNNISGEFPLFYVFGYSDQRGFHHLDSTEGLIPGRFFLRHNAIKIKYKLKDEVEAYLDFPTGGMLQLMLYNDIRDFDEEFSRRYQELESIWMSSFGQGGFPAVTQIEAKRNSMINKDTNESAMLTGPEYISEFEGSNNKIHVVNTHFKSISKDNDPKLTIVSESFQFIEGGRSDRKNINDSSYSKDYKLTNTLKIFDADWNKVEEISDTITQSYYNTSILEIDHKKESRNFIVAVEFLPIGENTPKNPQIDISSIEDIIPLNSDVAQLEISSIISGTHVPKDMENIDYPFPVIPAKEIRFGENLKLYFEVYHLSLGPDGTASYDVEISLEYLKKRRFRSDRIERMTQKTTYLCKKKTAKKITGFVLDAISPGEYDFTVEVTDNFSGQKKCRTGKFNLVKEEK